MILTALLRKSGGAPMRNLETQGLRGTGGGNGGSGSAGVGGGCVGGGGGMGDGGVMGGGGGAGDGGNLYDGAQGGLREGSTDSNVAGGVFVAGATIDSSGS